MVTGPSATMEVYKPWYFNATRPALASAPPVIAYGQPFPVATPDAENIHHAVLMRLGSVTHSLNTDQRLVRVSTVRLPGGPGGEGLVLAQAPLFPTVAPPGYYLLFLLDGHGVPSKGAMVHLLPGQGLAPSLPALGGP